MGYYAFAMFRSGCLPYYLAEVDPSEDLSTLVGSGGLHDMVYVRVFQAENRAYANNFAETETVAPEEYLGNPLTHQEHLELGNIVYAIALKLKKRTKTKQAVLT